MKGVPLPDEYVVDDDIKPRVSMDKTVNTCGERLIDICITTGLKIVNGRFGKDEGTGRLICHTYSGGSVIDYVLTESAYFTHLCNFEVWDPLLAFNHCPIQLELFYRSHGVPICAPQHSRHDENPRHFKLDVTQMDHFLEVVTRDQVQGLEGSIDGLNVTESAKILEAHIKELGFASGVLIHCKKKNSKRPANCWFDDECRSQKRLTNQALNNWKSDLTNSTSRELFYNEKRKFKKLTRLKKCESMELKNTSLSVLRQTNPKEFWKRVNVRRRKKQNHLPQSITTDQWLDHFMSLHQSKGNTYPTFQPVSNVMDDILDARISTDELCAVLKQMKNGKAPGMDGIMIDIYKVLPQLYLNLLVHLWNKILETSQIPHHWCTGIIVPIHKSGDKLDVDNYRGITLLPVIAKLLFAIISNRLYLWAESNEQFGFRTNHRSVDAMFILNALIENAKSKRTNLYCCFVDFKKAFDSVQHHLLWQKLSCIGVSMKVLNLLINTYAKARCCSVW